VIRDLKETKIVPTNKVEILSLTTDQRAKLLKVLRYYKVKEPEAGFFKDPKVGFAIVIYSGPKTIDKFIGGSLEECLDVALRKFSS
jgi:hypothetical protein